jgi:cyclopropane fatty-acyl-phospholipid synthase-like methyltransferase
MRRPSTDDLWERFAVENAEGAILTDEGFGQGEPDIDRFFVLGERDATLILEQVKPWIRNTDTAVEIGCGVGRLAIPMAQHFRRVVAIDVSRTMLDKCGANCADRGVVNVFPVVSTDAGPSAFSADLVYSHLVFQHLEEFEAIRRYVELAYSWLRPHGVASLQFDTRPSSLAYRLRARVPDALLPSTKRRGLRRIRRSRDMVRDAIQEAGFAVLHETGVSSDRHVVVARPLS